MVVKTGINESQRAGERSATGIRFVVFDQASATHKRFLAVRTQMPLGTRASDMLPASVWVSLGGNHQSG